MENHMEKHTEYSIDTTKPSEEAAALPSDIEALLRRVAGKERATVILPAGCGQILLGLSYLRRYTSPALVVARNAESAAVWVSRWREAVKNGIEPSRDPCAPHDLTVTDRASLRRIYTEGKLRELLEAWRGITEAVLLIEEPYRLGDMVLEVLERISETVSHVKLLGIASKAPYDISSEARGKIEAVCGGMTAAVGIPSMVRRGVLRPHRDFLYLSHPDVAEEETLSELRRIIDTRAERVCRLTALPFMRELGRRLLSREPAYLYARRDEVRAVALLAGMKDPDAAERLLFLLGGGLRAPTEGEVERAVAFLLRSRSVLLEEEKERLSEILSDKRPGDEEEAYTVFSDRETAWRCTSRSAAKLSAITELADSEEATLGRELRMLLAVTPEDAALCFERLLRRGSTPVAWLAGDRVYLSDRDGLAERFSRLCRGRVVCERATAPARYVICCPTEAEDIPYALEALFADGDIRILLVEGTLPGGGYLEGLSNVLVLSTPTEWRASEGVRYAEAAEELRGRVLLAHRYADDREYMTKAAASRRTVHVFHVASAVGDSHPAVAEDADESEAVLRFLQCVAMAGREELPPQLPSGRTGQAAFNAAMREESRKRRRTLRVFAVHAEADAPRAEVTVPPEAKVPAVTPGRVVGLCLAAICMAVGGYLTPHLIRLILQARGMLGVLAIFLGLLAVAAGMLTVGGVYIVRTVPYILRHRSVQSSVGSLVKALLRALRESGAVGESVTATVERPTGAPKSDRRLTVRVEGATYAEADCVCRAVAEMLSPIRTPRYILCRSDRAARRARKGKRGVTVALSCPSVLSAKDADTALFAAYMRVALGRSSCIYTRRGRGSYALAEARARGYLDHGNEPARVYVSF